jgi:hypothetical protein
MAAAEDNLGGVGARQVEGDPHTTAEKSEDEALKEVSGLVRRRMRCTTRAGKPAVLP